MKCEPCGDLKDQDQRQAIPELRFALLVPKNDHSGYTADRAAQNRKNKEHGLRNSMTIAERPSRFITTK